MATRSFVPRADGEGGIGTSLKRWLNGFFKKINGLTISPTGAATTSAPGMVALATAAEAVAGADTSKAVTPAGMAAAIGAADSGSVAHSALTGVDTDASQAAIHHTLGTGANQAAPGNHTHPQGSGSGMDADTVDGMQPASASTGSTVVSRDANGDFAVRYITAVYLNMSHAAATRNGDTVFFSSTDAYLRKNTKAGMLASLGLTNAWTSNNDGPGSGMDADTVDGKHATELMSAADGKRNALILG